MKRYLLAACTTLALPQLAQAQIVYAPAASDPSAIPALTTTMLLASIVLLILAARWVGFHRRENIIKLVAVLGVCMLATGTLSVKLISDVYADGGGTNFGFLSFAGGGSVPITDDVLNIFENTSGVAQRITSITLGTCPDVDSGFIDGVARCMENLVVSTDMNGLCYTDCRPQDD